MHNFNGLNLIFSVGQGLDQRLGRRRHSVDKDSFPRPDRGDGFGGGGFSHLRIFNFCRRRGDCPRPFRQ